MAYTFDYLDARDPANPANRAANASVTIHAVGDATKTPLTITTTDGTPLPNPITVGADGYGPAFMHATLDRVAWSGGGYTNFMTAYEGIKNEAIAARTAADTAAAEAALAESRTVTTATVNGSGRLILTKADATTLDAGAVIGPAGPTGPTGPQGLPGVNAVDNDTAVAGYVNNTTSATRGALNATYASRELPSFGSGASASNTRMPFTSSQALTPSAAGTNDKIAHSLSTVISGNFSGATGTNPTFAWGLNVFTATGKVAGDANAADIQNLMETAIQAPAGSTIATATGLMSDVSFLGSTAGATVNIMQSMRVGAPRRKDGATAGTATTVYGLFVENVDAAATGATSAFALFVEGGISRFAGRVDVTGKIANNGAGDLELNAGFAKADGATLNLMKTASGGHAEVTLQSNTSLFVVSKQGTGALVAYGDGRVQVGSTATFGNAAGAALALSNTATAPTAAPTGGGVMYVEAGALKYRGSTGTITTIAPA